MNHAGQSIRPGLNPFRSNLMTTLLTINQAADLMGVSRRHVERLIDEAQTCPKIAKWREKRDFVDLSRRFLPDHA